MKYIELFEKFNNKQLADIDDILLELKDDGFNIEIKRDYKDSLHINLSREGDDVVSLGYFKFSRIEDVVKRLIDYLNQYKFSFIAYDLNVNLVKKSIDEISSEDYLVYFQLFFTKD
jgi:hypothetical protein